MADKTVSSLTAATTPDGTEEVHVVQSTNSRKTTLEDIAVLGRPNIEDDGANVVTDAKILNFTGAGVTVSDAGSNQADIAISGGGGGSFSGVSVTKSANQTSANYTGDPAITWDSEFYDTDNRHDNATNSERITFGAGDVGKVASVLCTVRIDSITAGDFVQLAIYHKNSAGAAKKSSANRIDPGSTPVRVSTAMLTDTLADGDFVEARLFIESDTSVTITITDGQSALDVVVFG